MSQKGKSVERGQAITFRVPSDTPDYLLKQLSKLKEKEKRNFSSKVAEFVLKGVGEDLAKDRETITIPMPRQLTKSQRSWLKHEHSEALLGTILYQLLADPVRATALLTSLNSSTIDIEEALDLQEKLPASFDRVEPGEKGYEQETGQDEDSSEFNDDLDDLESFDMEKAMNDLQESRSAQDEDEGDEEEDDLLGGFLTKMNK
ncbi:hypothetical protein [Bacillus marinisedimentorum]|uniref:hypothetical protein n=1 Tax=Bacillus marinisedimentorum TaxID=1821260 RepID=UPI000872204B|nr:hypothetical protein [Bacillus marinisedimentorum]